MLQTIYRTEQGRVFVVFAHVQRNWTPSYQVQTKVQSGLNKYKATVEIKRRKMLGGREGKTEAEHRGDRGVFESGRV